MLALEKIYKRRGKRYIRMIFENLLKYNREKAICLINEKNISFEVIYVLIPLIFKYKIYNEINEKNKIAVRVYANFNNIEIENEAVDDIKMLYALRWIVKSAICAGEIDYNYDRLIDYSVAKLLEGYKDYTIIPQAVDIIFIRNRKGENVCDLVQSIVKSKDFQLKNYLRKYLESNNISDRKLAQELLDDRQMYINKLDRTDGKDIEEWQKYKSRDLFKHLKQEGDIKQV